MAFEAAAEDFEDEVEVGEVARAVDHSERAQTQGRGDVAGVVAVRTAALHGHHRRGRIEPCEEFQEAWAALGEIGVGGRALFVEREGEVHDRDMNLRDLDDAGGMSAGVGLMRANTHRLQEAREAVDPRVGLPGAAGKEEVEARAEPPTAARIAGVGVVRGMLADGNHEGNMARGVPGGRASGRQASGREGAWGGGSGLGVRREVPNWQGDEKWQSGGVAAWRSEGTGTVRMEP